MLLSTALSAFVLAHGSADVRSANITRGSIVNPEPIQSFSGGFGVGVGEPEDSLGVNVFGWRVWTCNHLTDARDDMMKRCFNETDPYLYVRNRVAFAEGWSLLSETGPCWVLYRTFKNADDTPTEVEWRVRQEFETPWATPYYYMRDTFTPYDLLYWQTGVKRAFEPIKGLTVTPFGYLDWGNSQLFRFKYGTSRGEFSGGVSAIDVGFRCDYAVSGCFFIWAQFDSYWIVNEQARGANHDRTGIGDRNEICVFSTGIDIRF